MSNLKRISYLLYTAFVVMIPSIYLYTFNNFSSVFIDNVLWVVSIFLVYLVSHFIRALRLYILASQENIKFLETVRLYFNVLFLSTPIPYKLGDIIKVLELNIYFKSKVKGLLIVIIERFLDSIVLLIILLFMIIFANSTLYQYKLIIFILISVIAFCIIFIIFLKSLLSYIEFYALHKSENHFTNRLLILCTYIKKIILYVSFFMNGKFTLMILITLFIWLFEILAFVLFTNFVYFDNTSLVNILSRFLLFVQDITQAEKNFGFYYLFTYISIFMFGIIFFIASFKNYVLRFKMALNKRTQYYMIQTNYRSKKSE